MWKGQGFCNYIDKLACLWLPPHLQVSQVTLELYTYLCTSVLQGWAFARSFSSSSSLITIPRRVFCPLLTPHRMSWLFLLSLTSSLSQTLGLVSLLSPHENELDPFCLPAPILNHIARMHVAYILKEKQILRDFKERKYKRRWSNREVGSRSRRF